MENGAAQTVAPFRFRRSVCSEMIRIHLDAQTARGAVKHRVTEQQLLFSDALRNARRPLATSFLGQRSAKVRASCT
jgi:hypothetical protein